MRICLVSSEYIPFRGGGIGTYVTLMADSLVAAGHEVHVLTDPVEGMTDGERRSGRHFHFWDVTKGLATLDAFPTTHMRRAMAIHEKLQALHRTHPFQFIEFPEYGGEGYFATRAQKLSRTYEGAILAVRLHTPRRDVDEMNDDWTLDWGRAEIDHLEESAIRDAELVLSPTHSLLQRMEARLGTFASKAVIPYPMSPLRQETPAASSTQRSPGVILYFGRLERRKGVHVLIAAMDRLLARGVNAELRMIGGDTTTGRGGMSMKADLIRLASLRVRSRLTLMDSMPRPQLAQEIAQAQVCCFPSIWENFPNVCLESMAQGALVVGSDSGGMAEVIEPEKSGLLFRSEDVESLTQALERALAHPNAEALREAAKARIQSYCDPTRVVLQLETVLRDHTANQTAAEPTSGATPKVSIVIPHFNLGAYLPETVASARAQTYPDVEIVIIEDGSTDPQSIEAVAQLEASGVRVVRQQNGGLSNARNTGLREASGEYVLMLDADDLIEPRYVSQCLSILTAHPDWVFATAYSRYFTEVPEDRPDGWIPWGLERDYLPYRNVATHCSAVFRKDALTNIGGYDEHLTSFEDWELMCRLAKAGAQGGVIPEFLFHYRIRPESMLRTEGNRRRERLISYLLSKHADLPLNPERTLRLGVERNADPPLRYRLVDKLNQGIKRLPVIHPLLRRASRKII